jgi:hypothetical protein
MGAGSVAVVDVRKDYAAQMSLVERHDVIQALTNRTYDALEVEDSARFLNPDFHFLSELVLCPTNNVTGEAHLL